MKAGSIDLSEVQVIPAEGYFVPNGDRFSVALKCADLSAATADISLLGRAKNDGDVGFGYVQNDNGNVTFTLTSGIGCFVTFDADHETEYRLDAPTGVTGTLYYEIKE